jgi:DNA modification methylase
LGREKFSLPAHVVCDPFVGSGAFPVIAHHLDRDVIACDTELENVQKTRARLGLA